MEIRVSPFSVTSHQYLLVTESQFLTMSYKEFHLRDSMVIGGALHFNMSRFPCIFFLVSCIPSAVNLAISRVEHQLISRRTPYKIDNVT